MTFATPLILLALLALPLLVGLYVLAQRRRRTYAIRFTMLNDRAFPIPHGKGFSSCRNGCRIPLGM